MRALDFASPILALALTAAGLVPAAAQVVAPQRKPGLWEMSMVNSTRPGAIKSQMCTDATVEKRFSVIGGAEGPRNCTTGPVRKTAAGYAFETVCKSPRGVATTSGVATGDFQTSYQIQLTTKLTPLPPGAPPQIISTATAKWLGLCPIKLKPGDMVQSNGMVINMMALPPNGPGLRR